ncbi:hypothetical protein NC652_039929 [Populus alba x Populus x berolinensis]|nr:hypothetical protein NC652_039929 [Populus alba x Populus x berolinensis]
MKYSSEASWAIHLVVSASGERLVSAARDGDIQEAKAYIGIQSKAGQDCFDASLSTWSAGRLCVTLMLFKSNSIAPNRAYNDSIKKDHLSLLDSHILRHWISSSSTHLGAQTLAVSLLSNHTLAKPEPIHTPQENPIHSKPTTATRLDKSVKMDDAFNHGYDATSNASLN